jgi:hypothetical protein
MEAQAFDQVTASIIEALKASTEGLFR